MHDDAANPPSGHGRAQRRSLVEGGRRGPRSWSVSAYSSDPALSYDRLTGSTTETLGELAASAPGTTVETFHFVLNDTVVKDNRIPAYGMSYDEAKTRNALPVPATQYGWPTIGGSDDYFCDVALNPL